MIPFILFILSKIRAGLLQPNVTYLRPLLGGGYFVGVHALACGHMNANDNVVDVAFRVAEM